MLPEIVSRGKRFVWKRAANKGETQGSGNASKWGDGAAWLEEEQLRAMVPSDIPIGAREVHTGFTGGTGHVESVENVEEAPFYGRGGGFVARGRQFIARQHASGRTREGDGARLGTPMS